MVDRIDLYERDEKLYVRIVDYKSGMHEFSPEDIRSGLDIQLVLYLLAVVASDKARIVPAGAQYLYAKTAKGVTEVHRSGFLMDDACVLDAADQTPDECYTKKLKKMNEGEILELFDDMKNAVKGAAERIINGVADKSPSEKACTFCPIRMHCDKAWHK
jgi:ATP-dependent helicase/DNAse subunit B